MCNDYSTIFYNIVDCLKWSMKETNKMMPNLQLRRERERRNLSQEQLSQKIGTTALSISRWERGITSPGLHFRQKLTEFFGKSITDLGLTEEEIDALRNRFLLHLLTGTSYFPSPINLSMILLFLLRSQSPALLAANNCYRNSNSNFVAERILRSLVCLESAKLPW